MPFYSSYPVDHYDPMIRYEVNANGALSHTVNPFFEKAVTPQVLRQLGDSLAPNAKTEAAANRVVNQLVKILQNCPGLSIDRCCVSGSFGKKTSLVIFDIDLVVFVNDEEPPFTSVIQLLEKYVPSALNVAEVHKTTRFSIQFLTEGFKVDLLPAQNLVHETGNGSPANAQRINAIAKLKTLTSERDRAYWSSAFAESIVHFMKAKKPFVNAAVRICKFWKKACKVTNSTFPTWFSSFMVEIIAIDAAEKELEMHLSNASLVLVLKAFLENLANPNKIKIIGNHVEKNIPKDVLKQRPLIMDPVNPFNNVANRIGDWMTIQVIAQATLDALNAPSPTIKKIFTTRIGNDLPRLFQYCNFQLHFISNTSYLRSLTIEDIKGLKGQRVENAVEWRKEVNSAVCSDKAKEHILMMFQNFVNLTNTMIFHHIEESSKKGEREVKAVADFLDDVLLHAMKRPKGNWLPCSDSHESCDVSLTFAQIPLPSPTPNDLQYIHLKLSFNIDEYEFYHVVYQIDRNLNYEAENSDTDTVY